jgi:hypothetical protein
MKFRDYYESWREGNPVQVLSYSEQIYGYNTQIKSVNIYVAKNAESRVCRY